MALTDEDVARIADEMERRMSKRREKPSHASYGGNGRYLSRMDSETPTISATT